MQLPSRRRLGRSDIEVTSVALGCWPISGMTSLNVTEQDSLATLQAAIDSGVNFFDTAYCYGAGGESESLIRQAIRDCRDQVVLATKGGIHWDPEGKRVLDARPETLIRECDESLRRLAVDHVELYYLHAPDADTPIEASAESLRRLQTSGKTREIGASNCSLSQLKAIHQICPLAAVQPPYNMLQRQIEQDLIPWCREQQISVVVYWPLLKGLLAGKLPRDFVFAAGDGRAKYPPFQGEEWEKNQDFLDDLRKIAAEDGRTVAQLVVAWTIEQPNITAALCGAKRPEQIKETAAAMQKPLTPSQRTAIQAALTKRGEPKAAQAV